MKMGEKLMQTEPPSAELPGLQNYRRITGTSYLFDWSPLEIGKGN
jgi:hypothetical protein